MYFFNQTLYWMIVRVELRDKGSYRSETWITRPSGTSKNAIQLNNQQHSTHIYTWSSPPPRIIIHNVCICTYRSRGLLHWGRPSGNLYPSDLTRSGQRWTHAKPRPLEQPSPRIGQFPSFRFRAGSIGGIYAIAAKCEPGTRRSSQLLPTAGSGLYSKARWRRNTKSSTHHGHTQTILITDSYVQLSDKVADLAGSPASMPLDGLRLLERKTATVCTLLKASVYSIVLQQQIWNENEEQQQQQDEDQFQDRQYQRGFDGDVTF